MDDSPHFHYLLDSESNIVILCATCRSVVATTDREAYIHRFEEFHQCLALQDHKAELVLPNAEYQFN